MSAYNSSEPISTSNDENFLTQIFKEKGGDEQVALELARNPHAPLEVLRELAHSGSNNVKTTLIFNPKSDGSVFKILAQSNEIEVLNAYLDYVGT